MVELRTDRLTLRRFRPSDVDDALAYRGDPEFARYLPHVPQPFTRSHAEEFVAINIADRYTWAVVVGGRVIGTTNLEVEDEIAMLGYALARTHWGRGLATEAARTVLGWAFPALALERIWASTDVDNARSRRVLAKLGMRHEDTRGREVFYGLPRAAWYSAPIAVPR
ncbi:MAG: GNAT family N-acetyltransferase [Deltaproteobacteria bacterium]|nr:GNAT family N-acetyltransferase [Deltaproteobacteria bacterium]